MSGLIPASELTALRATATSALDIAGVQIQHNTPASNGDGTYSDVIGSATSYVIRVPYGTTYHANDRLLMPSGEVLRIQADLSDSSYSTAMLLLAVRIQP